MLCSCFLFGSISNAEVIRMDFEKQLNSNWCWAAVTAMTVKYMLKREGNYQSPTRYKAAQCVLATYYNTNSSNDYYCCENQNGASNRCNKPGSVGKPLARFKFLDKQITGQLTDSTFRVLSDQIGKKLPVPAGIKWSGRNVGHAITVYGIGMGGFAGGQVIYIYDSITGRQAAFQSRNSLNNYGSSNNGSWKAMYKIKNRR